MPLYARDPEIAKKWPAKVESRPEKYSLEQPISEDLSYLQLLGDI
jgi:hypothetical protein